MIQYNVKSVHSLQDTIEWLEMKGLSPEEIKREINHKLKGQLPEDIYNRIKEEK